MVTDFSTSGRNDIFSLEKVKIFCHHGNHIDIPAFDKTFDSFFKTLACYQMKTIIDIYEIVV